MDPEVFKIIQDFNVVEKNGTVLVPDCALNGMDIAFYVNHSGTANLKTVDGGFNFITSRSIQKGEELCVNYNTYVDSADF